ncbi:WhiB family transcriptional regulator [Streptacidiphilus sp. EB129]|jgi:WhiB family redox-sensing transcriptional regulator|uniref:WhiB family transcriptional regulator n=1 Tax=Streptacidiphilus sp. EB129 TaxID=3156262 RepID=UPI0035141341
MTKDSGNWAAQGLCRDLTDPDALFADNAEQQRAKTICTNCPVRITCLSYALDQHIDHGVWGGQTARERRQLLRRRPTVTSWRALLEAAQADHAQQPRTAAA